MYRFFYILERRQRTIRDIPAWKQNIILTGFMGTGKTEVGQILARLLKRRFLDTDALVEQLTGLPVPLIFELHGETFFRHRESAVIAALDRYPPGSLVVATGGGAVLRKRNRKNLQQNGLIVLLTASPAAILRRVGTDPGRPLLRGSTSPAETVRSLLKKRETYYSGYQLKVDTTNVSPDAAAAEIIARLSSLEADPR